MDVGGTGWGEANLCAWPQICVLWKGSMLEDLATETLCELNPQLQCIWVYKQDTLSCFVRQCRQTAYHSWRGATRRQTAPSPWSPGRWDPAVGTSPGSRAPRREQQAPPLPLLSPRHPAALPALFLVMGQGAGYQLTRPTLEPPLARAKVRCSGWKGTLRATAYPGLPFW